MKKKIAIILVTFVFMISCTQIIKTYYINNFGLLISYKIPEKVTIYDDDGQIKYDNKRLIEKLYKQIRFKGLRRINHDSMMENLNNRSFVIEVDSERRFTIDKSGKVGISVEKGEIRNKSWLHWLWWKFDNMLYNDTYIFYLSNSDSKVIDIINEIKTDIENSK
jgi:hypothetical protein